MDARKELEIAIERAEDLYSESIYSNVLECYNAIEPIIAKEGHSGFSYSVFVRILTRVLQGKVLTAITEQDFEGVKGYKTDNDSVITKQCPRYSALFQDTDKNGNVTYHDVDRITIIDQYGMGWHSGSTERKCADYIPEIKLPYLPADEPIKIYVWQFSYSPECGLYDQPGTYNSEYIEKIVFPSGKVVMVNRLYLDDKEVTLDSPVFFQELTAFIEEGVKKFHEPNKR